MVFSEQLNTYEGITLSQMQKVRLMRRIDTKFVCSASLLPSLLASACRAYMAQEIDGRRAAQYYTLYYDTPRLDMYLAHLHGHANRQKLRVRSYVNSGLNFVEIKTKNNHGETRKQRVQIQDFSPLQPDYSLSFGTGQQQQADELISRVLNYEAAMLRPKLENRFRRITLVDYGMSERVTIDFDLRVRNLITGLELALPNIVIIETKRSGLRPSTIQPLLHNLGIKPAGFSKYAVGMALTHPSLLHNRFKPRLRFIDKLENMSRPSTTILAK